MASTNTPTAANHVATKAYVDSVGGGTLNVYKADGVTLMGKLLSISFMSFNTNSMQRCASITYLEPSTNLPQTLSSTQCGSATTVTSNAYFQGVNCTGLMRMDSTSNSYGCAGAATCTTNVATVVYDYVNTGNFNYASYRSSAGVCVNGANAASVSYDTQIINTCGSIGQVCTIKP